MEAQKAEGTAAGLGETMLQMGNRLVECGPQEIEVPSRGGSRFEGLGRKFRDLDADLLVKVFSYLPEVNLVEAMLVSRHWETAVKEGRELWRNVEVLRKWDKGSSNSEGEDKFFHRLLGSAQALRFGSAFDFDHESHFHSVGGVLGTNLRLLELPHACLSTKFLSLLLSNCFHLNSLVVKGEPAGQGNIHIYHPKLEHLQLKCVLSRSLTVDCPNLTHLATAGDEEEEQVLNFFPNQPTPILNCPRLTHLRLSPLHCAFGVLVSIAAHAPNIECLHVYRTTESPFVVLYWFESLRVLKVRECTQIGRWDFNRWPLLETLLLHGLQFACDLDLRSLSLKSLTVFDSGPISPTLACPSLEELRLHGRTFGRDCVENLHSSCPMLKRLKIGRLVVDTIGFDGRYEASNLYHETLEELELDKWFHALNRVACGKLNKLVIVSNDFQKENLIFSQVECNNLVELKVCSYHDVFSSLPSILSAFPKLMSLTVSEHAELGEDVILNISQVQEMCYI